jgi:hypothetical protein
LDLKKCSIESLAISTRFQILTKTLAKIMPKGKGGINSIKTVKTQKKWQQ